MRFDGSQVQNEIYVTGESPWPVGSADWEVRAAAKLEPGPFGYIAGGAGEEATMRANREAFERRRLRPRMLRGNTERELSVEVLGTASPFPFLLAPVGVLSIAHPDGELAPARAAAGQSGVEDVDTPAWEPVRELLRNLSTERARQGFTPTETATFVFSLKEPLFSRLRQELGMDATGLAEETWAANLLLDRLGLFTTETYQQSREELIARQNEAMRLGMWLFLATEILLFSGLFVGYAVYRFQFPLAFAEASRHLNLTAGTVNTVVLITSSFTVALALHFARSDNSRAAALCLALTILMALGFLGIKAIEYTEHFHEHALPGKFYAFKEVTIPGAAMFYSLYFLMTGRSPLFAGFWALVAAYEPGKTEAEIMAPAVQRFFARGAGPRGRPAGPGRGAAHPGQELPAGRIDPLADDHERLIEADDDLAGGGADDRPGHTADHVIPRPAGWASRRGRAKGSVRPRRRPTG